MSSAWSLSSRLSHFRQSLSDGWSGIRRGSHYERRSSTSPGGMAPDLPSITVTVRTLAGSIIFGPETVPGATTAMALVGRCELRPRPGEQVRLFCGEAVLAESLRAATDPLATELQITAIVCEVKLTACFLGRDGQMLSIQVEPKPRSHFDTMHTEAKDRCFSVAEVKVVTGPAIFEALCGRLSGDGRTALDSKPTEAAELESLLDTGDGLCFVCLDYAKCHEVHSTVYWAAGHVIRVVSA